MTYDDYPYLPINLVSARSLGKSVSMDTMLKYDFLKYLYGYRMSSECRIALRKNDKKKFNKSMKYQIRSRTGKDPKADSKFLDFDAYRKRFLIFDKAKDKLKAMAMHDKPREYIFDIHDSGSCDQCMQDGEEKCNMRNE